jgi:tetratricopeptide (TPR) repeat protein
MILLFALAAAAAAPAIDFKTCAAQAASAPEAAVATARQWAAKGGGADARLCEGLALSGLQRWAEAAAAFEQAAGQGQLTHDRRRADFWVEAGNAWLAAGEPARAIAAFDAALAADLLSPELRGEAHLDRARAEVSGGNQAGARADIDKALALVPKDPFAWYLSAALARRQNDLKRAQADIAKAVSLAPDEASILLEAGNIAGASGEAEAAKGLWERAFRAAPDGDAGRAAKAALAANPDSPAPPR